MTRATIETDPRCVERPGLVGVVGEHLAEHPLGVGRRERVAVLRQRLEVAPEARHRARRHLHVKVRALVFDDIAKRLVEIEHLSRNRPTGLSA
jgi:hypothetical protein